MLYSADLMMASGKALPALRDAPHCRLKPEFPIKNQV
jgi:hypothetical protein